MSAKAAPKTSCSLWNMRYNIDYCSNCIFDREGTVMVL